MQFVLVHGAWQGGWCWKYLADILRRAGHTVSCPDLPGHGANTKSSTSVTYDTYYQYLAKEITNHKEPIILVAHSMSGIIAAPILDQFPEHISHLFLIASFVAQNGQSLLDIAVAGGPSEIPNLLITDEKNQTYRLNPKKVKEALYFDCPSEVADWAIPQLQPQPIAPFQTAIKWKDSGKTQNKRTYIFCEQDRDVHPITQQNVLEAYPCRIEKMKSGHFPFLSQPKKLADILTQKERMRSALWNTVNLPHS